MVWTLNLKGPGAAGAPRAGFLQLQLRDRPQILAGLQRFLPFSVLLEQDLTRGREPGLGLVEADTEIGKMSRGGLGHSRPGRGRDAVKQVIQLVAKQAIHGIHHCLPAPSE